MAESLSIHESSKLEVIDEVVEVAEESSNLEKLDIDQLEMLVN